MTQIISIAPTGLIAYECPRCGHLISVIDPAKDDRSALSRAGRMAVDAWERAADCARAIEASKDPTRRALVGTLQKLWIELGNKERLLSEQHVLKEMEGLSIGTPKAGVGERGG